MQTLERRRTYQDDMRVELPDIDAEGVVVRRFDITPEESKRTRLMAVMGGGRGFAPAGSYTRLNVDGRLWMSDTPDEMRDHAEAYWEAQRRGGRVLINGLGLGMVVGAMLRLPQVEHIDVVELDERVARLIGEHYAGDRVTVHHADAYDIQWPTGTRWTVAWHDIWPTITGENLAGMHRLHRKYGRRTDWQGSWARWSCERGR